MPYVRAVVTIYARYFVESEAGTSDLTEEAEFKADPKAKLRKILDSNTEGTITWVVRNSP